MKIKLNLNNTMLLIVLIVFLEPPCIGSIDSLHFLDTMFSIIRILITIVTILFYITNRQIGKFTILVLLFCLIQIIASFFNGSLYTGFIISRFTLFGFILFCEIMLQKSAATIIDAAYRLFVSYISINLITMVLFPNGLQTSNIYYAEWFLGNKNIIIVYVIPCIFLAIIKSYKQGYKLTFTAFLIFAISVSNIILCKSSNSIAGIIIILAGSLTIHILPNIFYNIYLHIGIYVILFYTIVINFSQNILIKFFTYVLKRGITFSGRTVLWEQAISHISKNPFWGSGFNTKLVIGSNYWFEGFFMSHAHNLYLDITYKSGLFSTALFLSIVLLCILSIKKAVPSKYTKISSLVISAFLLLSMFEVYNLYILFFILLICTYIDNFSIPKTNRKGERI